MKLIFFFLFLFASLANAQERLVELAVEGSTSDSIPVLQNIKPDALTNIILIPGGNAGTGELINGIPSSLNLLVRSRQFFQNNGFNTFILFRARSVTASAMSTTYRADGRHLNEINSLINHIAKLSTRPIWIIGTSMGSISATQAALGIFNKNFRGIVLTSSVTRQAPGNLSSIDLNQIDKPLLIIHHKQDACFACVPSEALAAFKSIKNSNTREFLMLDGGGPPKGDPCQNQHWHGFIGMEEEVIGRISAWIKEIN